jgi:hypothetical protein
MKRLHPAAALCLVVCLAASESRAVRIAVPGVWVDFPIVIGGPSLHERRPAYQTGCARCRRPPRATGGITGEGDITGASPDRGSFGPPPPPRFSPRYGPPPPPHFGPPPGSRGHASPPPYYRVW